MLVTLFQTACANLGLENVTTSWDEDVVLHTGELLTVERSITRGPDKSGRRGRGQIIAQTISFVSNGELVKWTYNKSWPGPRDYETPDILDIVNGDPIVVLAVHHWWSCYHYAFPQEGLVAFRFHGKQWSLVPIAELPRELKVNLLRRMYPIEHRSKYGWKRMDPKTKVAFEIRSGRPKQDTSLSDVIAFYQRLKEACVRMRPPPNPQLDEARDRNTHAEKTAVSILAEVVTATDIPEEVTAKQYVRTKGVWTGAGFLTKSCEGVIDRIESVGEWHGDALRYQYRLIGSQLVLSREPAQRRRVQIQGWGSITAVCDAHTILAVRKGKDRLVIHRFTLYGDLIDALIIQLPSIRDYLPAQEWGQLWEFVPEDGGVLMISLANYAVSSKAFVHGSINQKIVYKARLPAK